MADAQTTTRIDTSDMVCVHNALRNALGAAAPLIGSAASGDAARVEMVGSFYANVLEFLRVHHEGEDVLLWPRLIERSPSEAETVRRIAGQHEGVHATLEATVDRLGAWQKDPQVDNSAQLAASLATLGAELGAHLAEEEQTILPIAAVHMTEEEWAQFPGHALGNFKGDKVWLVLGLVREQFNEEQLAHMDASMPPPVAEFWRNVGEPQFDAFIKELRG